MAFVHLHAPSATPRPGDRCLVIQADRLLAPTDVTAAVTLPEIADLAGWTDAPATLLHLGTLDGAPCWTGVVENPDAQPPAGWVWQDTRNLLAQLTPAQWHAVSCARQLAWWQRRHRFCGTCGTATVVVNEERACRCPACGALYFPVASPAVIVAVTRGDELLLAHNRNFRPGLFSLLAGFVDPGETLEQAAIREVREEVGLDIGGLLYVTSQPWSFPNSLMVGFRAAHRHGEIAVDGKEIEQAAWFTRGSLPEIPRPGTVARMMIDAWRRA
jgi:NAD+ diphosphatase